MVNILDKPGFERLSGNASQTEELHIANEDQDQLRICRYYLSLCLSEPLISLYSLDKFPY